MAHYFTDGSASPNPGPGGYAVILDGQPVALGREANSTNIRMEAQALIAAYKIAKAGDKISTDSEFWVNVVTKWAIIATIFRINVRRHATTIVHSTGRRLRSTPKKPR